MIEIQITKEITDFEPKLFGPFTVRQSICLIICVPICYVFIRFLSPVLTRDVALYFCFIPAAVAYAFGWARPYGMKMEQFLRAVYITRFLAPSHRKYKTRNTVERIISDAEAEWNEAEARRNEEAKTFRQKYIRKRSEKGHRYRLSPEAIK